MNEKKLMEQVVELYQIHVLCKNCGTGLPAGTKFCTNCGTKQEAVPGEEKHKTLFITGIVLLSLAAVGSGITAFVFFQKISSLSDNLDFVILERNYVQAELKEAENLIMAAEAGFYNEKKRIAGREVRLIPWKYPLDRAAVITWVYYEDIDSNYNYTYPADANKIAYLCFDFVLTGNIEIGESLSSKIIRASTGEDKCENRHTVTVTKKKEYSTGWGNASGGTYERGWYLIQILHKGIVIGQQYVYIQ